MLEDFFLLLFFKENVIERGTGGGKREKEISSENGEKGRR